MEDKLDISVVEHVMDLARIELTDEEKEQFAYDLKKLFDDVDKITTIKNYDEERMTSPVSHNAEVRDDVCKEEISFEEVKKNAPRTSANFVEVPVVIHE